MNPLLIKPVLDLAGNVFDRIFPDKEQAAKAKAEFVRQSAEMDLNQQQQFRDFVTEYEGRAADVHPALQILRGSVRPVLTYALAGLYGYGFLNPGEFSTEQMQGLFQLNLISMGFWYGERAMKKLGFQFKGAKNDPT